MSLPLFTHPSGINAATSRYGTTFPENRRAMLVRSQRGFNSYIATTMFDVHVRNTAFSYTRHIGTSSFTPSEYRTNAVDLDILLDKYTRPEHKTSPYQFQEVFWEQLSNGEKRVFRPL